MPQDPFYSSDKWRQCRASQLRRQPWCETCAQIGMQVRATQIDHRKSIRSGGAPFDPANLCSLCGTHHSQKTILVDGKHKAAGKLLVVTGEDGFPVGAEKGLYGKETTRERQRAEAEAERSRRQGENEQAGRGVDGLPAPEGSGAKTGS